MSAVISLFALDLLTNPNHSVIFIFFITTIKPTIITITRLELFACTPVQALWRHLFVYFNHWRSEPRINDSQYPHYYVTCPANNGHVILSPSRKHVLRAYPVTRPRNPPKDVKLRRKLLAIINYTAIDEQERRYGILFTNSRRHRQLPPARLENE